MIKKEYKYFKENTYIEKLDNGLEIHIIPNNKYKINYCYAIVNFGSIDSNNLLDGKKIPLGIAHFLEHRLFNYKDINYINEFENLNCSSNAYTTFNYTTYYFENSSSINKPLKLLLDMVLNCEMKESEFEKEKSIIINELYSRTDNIEHKSFKKLINNIYKYNLIKEEIVGSEESIINTTLEDIYNVHDYFYRPNNIKLVIVGNVKIEKTINLIKDYFKNNQKVYKKHKYKKITKIEPTNVVKKYDYMNIKDANKTLYLGFKLNLDDSFDSYKINKFSYVGDIYMDLLFGNGSVFFKERKKYFNEYNYIYQTEISKIYSLVTIKLNYFYKRRIINRLKYILDNSLKLIDFNELDTIRNSMIGNIYFSLNNNSNIADSYVTNLVYDNDIFNDMDMLLTINKNDILEFDKMLKSADTSFLFIENK